MNCSECAEFEFRRDQPFWWAMTAFVLLMLRGPRPSPFADLGLTWSAMLGGPPPATHYERHHEEYARTGDPLELERMLRQVNYTRETA